MLLVNRVYMAQDKYDFSRLCCVISTMKKLRLVVDNSARTVNYSSDTDEVNYFPQNMMFSRKTVLEITMSTSKSRVLFFDS